MRIALLQIASPLEEPATQRLARVGAMVRSVADADLIVLPELWACGYFAFDEYARCAEGLDGPLLAEISGWARRPDAYMQPGSVLERGSGGQLFNTAVLLGPDGRTRLEYRKMHVFGYQSLEARLLAAGDRADVVHVPFGRVGMTTCYDLRFPELYRVMIDRGAELFIVPAAWPQVRLEHWQLLTRARAIENQAFLIACNAAGRQGDVRLAGHSTIIDPWGRIVVEAGDHEQIVYAEIDLGMVADIRSEFTVLDDRRLISSKAFRRPVRARGLST